MEKYRFSEQERKLIERSSVPFSIYQYIDKRVVTVAMSDGHREIIGTDTIEEAMDLMDNNMYRDVHPDDIAKVASAALAFATDDNDYDVLYRYKHGDKWLIIHSKGKHIYTEDGVRLAEVSYTNEGFYDPNSTDVSLSMENYHEMYFKTKEAIDKLRYDYLTGLPDVNYFFELAETEHTKAKKENRILAMLFIDLNGMQGFNQSYGYEEGDRLIKAMGRLLARTFKSDNCCRTTADHFAVYTDSSRIEVRINDLIEDIKLINDGKTLPVKIGVYYSDLETVSAATATDRAKIACDACGNVYESAYVFFDKKMLKQFEDRKHVFQNLDRAMEEGWLKVCYQPIIRTANGRVCDEEALIRWNDPEKGVFPPLDFIPILEDAKVAYKLDLYVLEQVLKKIKDIEEKGFYIVPNSINLSRTDFYGCDIVEEIRQRVDEAGVDRSRITIEITESVVMKDVEFMMIQVNRFRELGFSVWLDDFGSGFSAPDILQKIHFDVVKIDKVFVDQIEYNENSRIIITELVRLANGLGCETVAEGVESKAQVDFLNEIGCTRIQGYYYRKPLPLEDLLRLVDEGKGIGFENPEESEYFSILGNVNLYDASFTSEEEAVGVKDYFNTMPMFILEVSDKEVRLARGNKSFREFIDRHYMLFQDIEKDDYAHIKTLLNEEFFAAIEECKKTGHPVLADTRSRENGVVHLLFRRIATNPVTGVVALAIVVLGYEENDEALRHQEAIEHIKQERRMYNRISALSGDVMCIYNVDPKTGRYVQYIINERYAKVGITPKGDDFFGQSMERAKKIVHPDDLDYFYTEFTEENILDNIEKNGIFSVDMRFMYDGEPKFTRIRAMIITEEVGEQIIVGIIEIDKLIKKEQEYSEKITAANNMANKDTLTGVKNKHAYVDAELKLNSRIEEGEDLKFAVSVFDLNGLKEINDTHGHQEGDKFIKEGCHIICETFKHSPVFRIGGDEFAVISQGEDYNNIVELVKKIDETNVKNQAEGKVVIAVGMARYNGDRNVATVFAQADKNMYNNKRALKER